MILRMVCRVETNAKPSPATSCVGAVSVCCVPGEPSVCPSLEAIPTMSIIRMGGSVVPASCRLELLEEVEEVVEVVEVEVEEMQVHLVCVVQVHVEEADDRSMRLTRFLVFWLTTSPLPSGVRPRPNGERNLWIVASPPDSL